MASKKPKKPNRAGRPADAPDIPTAKRLEYARNILASVKRARTDYVGQRDSGRRLSAVRAFITEGVSLTWTLQKLRHREADFDEWYEPWASALRDDPVARFFYLSRAPVIHEGQIDLTTSMTMEKVSTDTLYRALTPLLPAGGFSIVIGDASEGGTSYATGSDGKRLYFDMPGISSWEWIQGTPDELRSLPLPVMMDQYVSLLERVMISATLRFGHSHRVGVGE